MKRSVMLLVALVASAAVAQGNAAERIAALEQEVSSLQNRVAQLEQRLALPAPPAGNVRVEEFTFARLMARQTSIGLELVGEVSAASNFSRVDFRVTYYAADGSILETDTFSVEAVGATPRTFDAGMFSDTAIDDIHSFALQVERRR